MAKPGDKSNPDTPVVIQNRKARHDYEILQSHEAGISLLGSEVKSLYLGKGNLTDSYCLVRDNELFLMNLDIEPYEKSSYIQHERRRDRKLLLHRKEIDLISRKSQEKGLTIIPLKVYFKKGRVKVEIALARGKRQYDKRDKIAADEARKEAQAAKKLR